MSRLPRDDEQVARALDGGPPADTGVATLVAVADRLRELGGNAGLSAEPGFRAVLRARLLADAPDLLPQPRTPVDPLRRRAAHGRVPRHSRAAQHRGTGSGRPGPVRQRDRLVAAAVFAAVALTGTTVVASGGALPGDPLYGLKRRVEGVELAFSLSDSDRGRRHLQLARARAEEVRTVAAPDRGEGPVLAALEDMDAQTRDGVRLLTTAAARSADDRTLTDLAAWTTRQRDLLAAAQTRLPPTAGVRAALSVQLLRSVSGRVNALQGRLPCGCAAEPADDLGPLPCGRCAGQDSGGSAGRPTGPGPAAGHPTAPGPVEGSAMPTPPGLPQATSTAASDSASSPAGGPEGSVEPSPPDRPRRLPTGPPLPPIPTPTLEPPPSLPTDPPPPTPVESGPSLPVEPPGLDPGVVAGALTGLP